MFCRICCVIVLLLCVLCVGFFFFKQKTAYEMRISDWSSDVCSSDLAGDAGWALCLTPEASRAVGGGTPTYGTRFRGDLTRTRRGAPWARLPFAGKASRPWDAPAA